MRALLAAVVLLYACAAHADGAARVIAKVRGENKSAALAALRKRKLTLLAPRPSLGKPDFDSAPATARVTPGSETTFDGKRVIAGTAWGILYGGGDLLVRDAQGVIHLLLLQTGAPKVRRTVRVKVATCGECTARMSAVSWWVAEAGCYQGGAPPPPPVMHYYALADGEQVGPPISIDYPYTELEARAAAPCPPRP